MRTAFVAVSLAASLFLNGTVAEAGLVMSLDFESPGGYTTSIPEFSDGASDYFIRTDGSNVAGSSVYNGQQGSFYFAAMDIDGEGAASSQTLTISSINVASQTDLSLELLVAEDDDGSNQDWDANTSFSIYARFDGGSAFQIFGVEATGGTNTEPAVDTNFDGVGDGASITDTFANFTASIAGSGALLDLEFRFDNLDAGDEDIAIDNIRLSGTTVPEPGSSILFVVAGLVSLQRSRRKRQ